MSDDDNATNGGITPMQQLADQVGAMQTQIDALTTRLTDETEGSREAARLLAAITGQALALAANAMSELTTSRYAMASVSPASPCGGNDETPTPTKG